jgi:ABC-type transport system involved in multi-copper enzyme maturation permease subunit
MTGLVRSELLKIRTTNAWWWLAIGAFVMTALAFTINAFTADFMLSGDTSTEGLDPEQAEQIVAQQDVVGQAANIYTSGQFFGLLFVMLIGILMVTNEFYHQTATTTFLTTPHRTAVIAGKLITATMIGFAFWLVTTVLDLIGGVIFLEAAGYGHQIGEWGVTRAILLNLLAYAIWTIFGVGFGTLITNQLGAVLTAVVLYLVGTQAAQLIFFLLSNWLDSEALLEWQVVVPSIASQLMITGFDLPGSPPQWVGAAVLIGYAVVTGTIGIMLTRRRDIS